MKTNDELEILIQNLIERVNRVEAAVAHMKPAAVDVAINVLEQSADELEARRLKMLANNACWLAGKKRNDR